MWVRVIHTTYADLAHLVERDLAKVEVAGSSPVIRLYFLTEANASVFSFFSKKSIKHLEVSLQYRKNVI